MIFNLTPETYVLALWFARLPGNLNGDFLGVALREKPGQPMIFRYRMRYYSGTDDPFDDTDRKSTFEGTFPDTMTEDRALAQLDLIFGMLGMPDMETHVIKGGQDAVLAVLSRVPWAHLKRAEGGST